MSGKRKRKTVRTERFKISQQEVVASEMLELSSRKFNF